MVINSKEKKQKKMNNSFLSLFKSERGICEKTLDFGIDPMGKIGDTLK